MRYDLLSRLNALENAHKAPTTGVIIEYADGKVKRFQSVFDAVNALRRLYVCRIFDTGARVEDNNARGTRCVTYVLMLVPRDGEAVDIRPDQESPAPCPADFCEAEKLLSIPRGFTDNVFSSTRIFEYGDDALFDAAVADQLDKGHTERTTSLKYNYNEE